jgi:adenylate cyclase
MRCRRSAKEIAHDPIRMTRHDTTAIFQWLLDGARSASDMQDLLATLCDRLLGCGIPIWRVGLFVLTLHPQIMGIRFLWKIGTGVEVGPAPFEAFQSEDFLRSPVMRVRDTGIALRRRLADRKCPIDFTVIRELQAEGATDYIAVPLPAADGGTHAATFTTRQPDGFTDSQIASLDSLVAPLARVIENRTLQRTASALLDTYVGNHAGARILAGQIRRGDSATIDAAIWLSDMRGFTGLADRLPPQTLIDLLNRYFDCQVPAILAHGGEVLKFMGDGLLSIFAISPGGGNAREVCQTALSAACEARTAILGSFGAGGDPSSDAIRFGLALHVGQVSYGNIGSQNRLDFTCIGPAVNLAARIEKLAGKLGRSILASDEFAHHVPSRFEPAGQFVLPGFGTARAVFGLKDEAHPEHLPPSPSKSAP